MRLPAAIFIAACVAGCGPMAPISSGQLGDRPDIAWPFQPTSMRIHPLTRLVRSDEGKLQIEIRVEFRDSDDHPTRGVGLIDLFLVLDGRPAQRWSYDLDDLKENRRRYDDITRTYRFLVGVSDEDSLQRADSIVLTSEASSAQSLQADLRLK